MRMNVVDIASFILGNHIRTIELIEAKWVIKLNGRWLRLKKAHVCMQQKNKPSLVQIMSRHLFGAKALSEPMLVKFEWKYDFLSRKWIWKFHFQNGSHFVLASMCSVIVQHLYGGRPTNDISIEFNQNLQCSSLKCTLPIKTKFCTRHDSWRAQNFTLIGSVYYKLEHSKFWSNFEFDQNIVNGTGARFWFQIKNKKYSDMLWKNSQLS